MLLDAGTFLAGAVLVALTVPGRRGVVADGAPGREPYLGALRSGLGYLRHDRLVRGIVLMLLVTNLADAAYTGILSLVWASEVVRSSTALGLLTASFALGAVLGNVAFTVLAPRVPRFAVFAVGFERIPERLRARVLGLIHAVAWAGIPLGGLLGGLAVLEWGLPAACLLLGRRTWW